MSRFSPHQNVVNYNAQGRQDRLVLGIFLMALGETFLVGMGAIIKYLSTDIPLIQIVFFRNFLAILLILPLVIRLGLPHLKTQQIAVHFQRGLFGVVSMFCMFYAFAHLRLTEAVLLKALAPIMLSFMAWLILRERLPLAGWCAIALAFIGVVVIMQPGELDLSLSLGFVAGVVAALLAALAKIMVRRLGHTEPSQVIVFFFAVFGTLFTLPFVILAWQSLAADQWLLLICIATLATLGQLCITKAYTVAKAGRVAMFSYLSLPSAGLLGWLVWSETIDVGLVLGTLIIVTAGGLSFFSGSRNTKPSTVAQ